METSCKYILPILLIILNVSCLHLGSNQNSRKRIKDVSYKDKAINDTITNEECLFPVRDKSLMWGYVNSYGSIRIPYKYGEARTFSEKLSAVKFNGKYGYINEEGRNTIPFIYDDAGDFTNGIAYVGIKNFYNEYAYGFIDITGKYLTSPQFESIQVNNRTAVIECNRSDSVFVVWRSGAIIHSFKKDTLNSIYPVEIHENLIGVKVKDKYGFIDTTGTIIISAIYDRVNHYGESMAAVMINQKYGFINKTGTIVIPPKYDYAACFSDGLCPVQLQGYYGAVNHKGEIIIPCIYEHLGTFRNGLAIATKNVGGSTKVGVIDTDGEVVIDFKFSELRNFDSHGYAIYQSMPSYDAAVWGIINTKGDNILMNEYEYIYEILDSAAIVKMNGKSGVVKFTGEYIIEPKYDEIITTTCGYYILLMNGNLQQLYYSNKDSIRVGYATPDGKVIYEPKSVVLK